MLHVHVSKSFASRRHELSKSIIDDMNKSYVVGINLFVLIFVKRCLMIISAYYNQIDL